MPCVDVHDDQSDDEESSRSFNTRHKHSLKHLPKSKSYSGEGKDAAQCATFLQQIAAALQDQAPTESKAWMGKDIYINLENFKQHAYNEAAMTIFSKLIAEGQPSMLCEPALRNELMKIKVEATTQAVETANAVNFKKTQDVALQIKGCLRGRALILVTELGIQRFPEWRMHLLMESAGADPKLAWKLQQLVQQGCIIPDTGGHKGLNYRAMTSSDDVRAVYETHVPALYNILVSVFTAQKATEQARSDERNGTRLEAARQLNSDGELIHAKTPALERVLRRHTTTAGGADPIRRHRTAQRQLDMDMQIGEQVEAPPRDQDWSTDEDSDDETDRDKADELLLMTLDIMLAAQITDIRRSDEGTAEEERQRSIDEITQDIETKKAEAIAISTSDKVKRAKFRYDKAFSKKAAAKKAKALKREQVDISISRLLLTMSGDTDIDQAQGHEEVPAVIKIYLWFGYIFNAQQKCKLLAVWSEKAYEKAGLTPLYPESADAKARAVYITLMEQHQQVHRAKHDDSNQSRSKGGRDPNSAASGTAHACPHFKLKERCKHGDEFSCAAGLHDSSLRIALREQSCCQRGSCAVR